MDKTLIQDLGEYQGNHLWIKREDLIPFSFGGNKARKAELFFREIDRGEYDCVVTYGSGSSNHCRVTANLCCARGLECIVVSPEETAVKTYNSIMTEFFGAKTVVVPVSEVHDTIEKTLSGLEVSGRKPFFIPGGGHGDIGTEAYVQCYREIAGQEEEMGITFDDIFLASGTGTTQAGLICGKLMNHDKKRITGISIARKNPRGREVVLESVRTYMNGRASEKEIQDATVFIDAYTDGYGKADSRITGTIRQIMGRYGIPLDETYTGKAFTGMQDYIEEHPEEMKGRNILFIHTGGTPLFFDLLRG